MNKILAAAAVAVLSFFTTSAYAQSPVLGVLTCQSDAKNPGMTYVVFSQRPVSCTYEGADGKQAYAGTGGVIGVDLEYPMHDAMAYLVIGGTGAPAGVEGTYVGAKASFKLGAGISAQAGLAGAGNGFVLVPFGIGGGAGIGVTAGIGYLQLTRAK